MANSIICISLVALTYITIIFGVAMHKKRLDIVDVAWSGTFIVVAALSWILGSKGALQNLVTLLVIVWGIRLGLHILKRLRGSKYEDPRYQELRDKWRGSAPLNAYLRIFLTQGVLALIISTPVIITNLSEYSALGSVSDAGLLIWIIGFLFESIGDAQLARHLSDSKNKGKIMTTGLWKYTRHPNYFGEAAQWWGIFIIGLSTPLGWVGVIGPILITSLLLFISGVPLTEKRFEGRPGWREYKESTSMFIPLPSRKY